MRLVTKSRVYWLLSVPGIIFLVIIGLQIASTPSETVHFTAAQLDEVDIGMRKDEVEKVLGCHGVFEDFWKPGTNGCERSYSGSKGYWISEDGWIVVDFDQNDKACFIERKYPQKDDWTWTRRMKHWFGLPR